MVDFMRRDAMRVSSLFWNKIRKPDRVWASEEIERGLSDGWWVWVGQKFFEMLERFVNDILVTLAGPF